MQPNPVQQQAIEHNRGPLLLVAGAGTGKTRVITEKIKYFVDKSLAKPEEILALTFTDKAAGEMQNRVDEIMPLGYQEPRIDTFHSFCTDILRTEGLEIGLDTNFRLLTASQQWMLIRQNIFEFELDYYRPLGNPTKFISSLLQLFSRAQDEDITAEDYLNFISKSNVPTNQSPITSHQDSDLLLVTSDSESTALEKNKTLELAKAYKKYQELKIANSYLDFGDLISWTLKLFRQRPNILEKYRQQFKLIMVDEFQDTNYAQYQLVKLLAPAENNPLLMVVGDDDQSIYKWRGASITNVTYFTQDYPKTEVLSLTDNYRSGQIILDHAYTFIQHNQQRLEITLGISKKLTSCYQTKNPIDIKKIVCENGEQEAENIAKQLIDWHEQGYLWKDMAILSRANNHLTPFVNTLRRLEIPYQLVGNRGLFEQEEIRFIIAFLRILVDPKDNVSVFQWLHTPSLEITNNQILDLVSNMKSEGTSLWEQVESCAHVSIRGYASLIQNPRNNLTKSPASQIILDYLNKSRYLKDLAQEETLENQLKLRNINKFFDIIKDFEVQTSRNPLAIPNTLEFVNYINLLMEAGENPAQAQIEDIDTVNLMTVHAAKGLEFKAVAIPCLTKDRFPSKERGDAFELPKELILHKEFEEQNHVGEERRLFYVACTRSKEQLLLSWAKNYGGKREAKPSPFLSEMLGDIEDLAGGLGITEKSSVTANNKEEIALDDNLKLPNSLSYTQLETFADCPKKYFYTFILKIPTAPSATLNFGQTMHRTLHQFHIKKPTPNLEELLEIYKQQWILGGYDSPQHQQLAKERGEKILKDYYKCNQEKLLPVVYVEQKFTLKFGKTKLTGSIDRIGKNEKGLVEIVDYKTGAENKTHDELDKEAKSSQQLSIYALAAYEVFNIRADQLCLYYLEHQYKAETTRDQKELEKAREKIDSQIEEMKNSDFSATPGFLCQWCAFRQICTDAKNV